MKISLKFEFFKKVAWCIDKAILIRIKPIVKLVGEFWKKNSKNSGMVINQSDVVVK